MTRAMPNNSEPYKEQHKVPSRLDSGLWSPISPEKKECILQEAKTYSRKVEAALGLGSGFASTPESEAKIRELTDGNYKAESNEDIPFCSRYKRRRAEKAIDSDDSDDDLPIPVTVKRSRTPKVVESDDSGEDIPLWILSKRRQAQMTVDPEAWNDQASVAREDMSCSDITVDSRSDLNAKPNLMWLPREIHQQIAEYFPRDRDVASFASVCKKAADAITASVWRQRFIKTFDAIEGLSPVELSSKYAFRMAQSRKWICFDLHKWATGLSMRKDRQKLIDNQQSCLDMLRELILQSNAFQTCTKYGSKITVARNYEFIRSLVTPGTPNVSYLDIIDAVLNTDNDWKPETIPKAKNSSSLVMLIQLCLTTISLDPKCCNHDISHFDMSQAQVYAAPCTQPVFTGEWKQDINVRWLVHSANFFKHHLKAGNGEGLFEHSYCALKSDQLPQPWLGMISPGTQQLRPYWKGIQTFIPATDLIGLRADPDFDGIYPDEIEGPQSFHEITFYFDEGKFSTSHWPKTWEMVLKANPFNGASHVTIPTASHPRSRLRSSKSAQNSSKQIAAPEIKHFYGTSRGPKTAHFFGRLHALPAQGPQSKKIHGFQRLTFMKYYTTAGGLDLNGIWAYEGCVLPGGRIIIGRWWDANADLSRPREVYSGPFMFWNVEESVAEPTIDEEEALEFIRTNYELITS